MRVCPNYGFDGASLSFEGGEEFTEGVIYLSGESMAVYAYQEGGLRVVSGLDINTQRLEAMLSVENATNAALAEIDGVVYGLVTVTDNPKPDRTNMMVYDATEPRNPVKVSSAMRHSGDAQHVETFEVAGKSFVISFNPRSFGIVYLSDPFNPWLPIGSGAGDDGSNFRALAGASDFDIIIIENRLYGLVASPDDDGIQVMDITYLAVR